MLQLSAWQLRALALRCMAGSAPGYAVYQWLQHRLGECAKPAFWQSKFEAQVGLARELRMQGCAVEGARVLEVGTGWVPCVPIGFWMCGAQTVHTLDLNPHYLPDVLDQVLRWLGSSVERVLALWRGFAEPEVLRERWALARALAHAPDRFLEQAGIVLHAPANAAATGLPTSSIDIHYSTNVLEHIPAAVIGEILIEARRVVRRGGTVIHFIDPSDHFAYTDPTISRVNFLRYSALQWDRWAGNRLAYHNRLREPELRSLFSASGLRIATHRCHVNARSLETLNSGLAIDSAFSAMSHDELAREDVLIVAVNDL